mgnify:CR=1 FL=1
MSNFKYEDINEIDALIAIEENFGLSKFIGDYPSNELVDNVENQLVVMLSKYKNMLKIDNPVPKIIVNIRGKHLRFTFFDKNTGKRVLLGQWLENKGRYYDDREKRKNEIQSLLKY